MLDLIQSRYPSAPVTALVRTEAHSKELISKYAGVSPVLGDLDSLDVIESESRKADIVISKREYTQNSAPLLNCD